MRGDPDVVLRVVGSDFELDGTPVPYGLLAVSEGQVLQGAGASGSPVSIDFSYLTFDGTVVLVPEPSAGVLTLLCLSALRWSRKAS